MSTSKIIRKRERVTEVTHLLAFTREGRSYPSMLFPCDEFGNRIARNTTADQNYLAALGNPAMGNAEIIREERRYYQPPILLCSCGAEVVLSGFTNTCRCHRDYNSSGQLLASRDQWGEETGEHPADIGRIP